MLGQTGDPATDTVSTGVGTRGGYPTGTPPRTPSSVMYPSGMTSASGCALGLNHTLLTEALPPSLRSQITSKLLVLGQSRGQRPRDCPATPDRGTEDVVRGTEVETEVPDNQVPRTESEVPRPRTPVTPRPRWVRLGPASASGLGLSQPHTQLIGN